MQGRTFSVYFYAAFISWNTLVFGAGKEPLIRLKVRTFVALGCRWFEAWFGSNLLSKKRIAVPKAREFTDHLKSTNHALYYTTLLFSTEQ